MRKLGIGVVFLGMVGTLALAGCGGGSSEPVNVNGTYNLNLTNGPNGCMFTNFVEGNVSQNVMVTVAQNVNDPTQVSVTITNQGLVLVLNLLGIPTALAGTVDGNKIDATGIGSQRNDNMCTAQASLRVQAALDQNTLTGTITYSYVTNKSADCGVKNNCQTLQSFNGLRPLGGV